MYKNILVPVVFDHEPNVTAAIEVARALLVDGGEITLFHAVEEIPGFVATQLPAGTIERNLEQSKAELVELARSVGKDIRSAVASGQPSRSIMDHAEANGVDCIVIASHRPGLQDYLLGSTAARVVRHANCAVHVLR